MIINYTFLDGQIKYELTLTMYIISLLFYVDPSGHNTRLNILYVCLCFLDQKYNDLTVFAPREKSSNEHL